MAYYEQRSALYSRYTLMEATDGPLSDVLRRTPVPPALSSTLPLLIDVLRGARDLEAAGVAHCGLSADSIRVKDGRAIIGDLEDAAVLPEAMGGKESAGGDDKAAKAAAAASAASGGRGHVWAIGEIFALSLTAPAFEEAVLESLPSPVDEKARMLVRMLLDGLLEETVDRAWTAQEALSLALEVAEALPDVFILPPRTPMQLPECWRTTWE